MYIGLSWERKAQMHHPTPLWMKLSEAESYCSWLVRLMFRAICSVHPWMYDQNAKKKKKEKAAVKHFCLYCQPCKIGEKLHFLAQRPLPRPSQGTFLRSSSCPCVTEVTQDHPHSVTNLNLDAMDIHP